MNCMSLLYSLQVHDINVHVEVSSFVKNTWKLLSMKMR